MSAATTIIALGLSAKEGRLKSEIGRARGLRRRADMGRGGDRMVKRGFALLFPGQVAISWDGKGSL